MMAMNVLTQLGITLPVLAAPMAGGPTSPAMAIAATRAGSLGMLAAGYKTAQAVEEQIRELRYEAIPLRVNIFAHHLCSYPGPGRCRSLPPLRRRNPARRRAVRSDFATRAHRRHRRVRRKDP